MDREIPTIDLEGNIKGADSLPKELVIDGQPISTLSSSGQLLIPETIRSQMGLKAGDTLAFELKNGVLELKKVRIKLHYE